MEKGQIKTKILILDDEPMVLQALERLLRTKFEVLRFQDPGQAQSAIDTEQPEVVIADFTLSGPKSSSNGLDFLKYVQAHSPNSVRCLLSGHVDNQSLAPAINSQLIHRLFLKPWENAHLLLQIQEAVIQQKVLQERNVLAELAVTDPVTQIHNHRYFQDQLRLEVERAQRHQREFCLMMLDIDYFKRFNDQHGHPAGDQALYEIAQFLKSSIRNIDHLARYGGEEFAIILPDTSLSRGSEVAQRICRQFQAHFAHGTSLTPNHPMTISVGLASFPENGQKPSEIIDAADSALYLAKELGRNQSQVAQPS